MFLGIHLGNTNAYVQQNWQTCKEKLQTSLGRWKRLFKTLSYKGKVLICNQIAASKLLHYLAVLPPPENILDELQKTLIDFIWSGGRHWLEKSTLFLLPNKGGLGLTNLKARTFTLRFTLLRRYLQMNKHPAFHFISFYLRKYRNHNQDYHLFLSRVEPLYLHSLPRLHSEILQA